MTKEELKKEAIDKGIEYADSLEYTILKFSDEEGCWSQVEQAYEKGALDFSEPREKHIEELEKEISVLLSCKNCPENKGGLLCQKEYENKCLAQKIQFIKELQEENAELKADNDARKFAMAMSEKVEKQLRKENTKLKTDYEVLSCSVGDFGELQDKLEEEQRKNNGLSDNLTKAKEIISEWEDSFCCGADYLYLGNKGKELRIKSQKFLNSEIEK